MSIQLIDDVPCFSDESTSSRTDAFHHSAIADVLKDIIDSNSAKTIGLYGSWGIGKSSIVNMLKNKLDEARYCFTIFNAWKYSGDSFRREFLLEVAHSLLLDNDKHDDVIEELKRLNYAKTYERKAGVTITDFLKHIRGRSGLVQMMTVFDVDSKGLLQQIIFQPAGAFAMLVTLICIIVSLVFFALFPDNAVVRSISLPVLVLGIVKLMLPRVETIFAPKEIEVYDAKLIFPEQFYSEFISLIKTYASDRKIVVVVDDLDRCDADTIKDILVTLKTFIGNSECSFIVPIDDQAVVSALIARAGMDTKYGYEQLRKYFSITVRIPAIYPSDLYDFARTIAKECGVAPEVAFIGSLGNCVDARKIKHFINMYKIKMELAQLRAKEGLFMHDKLDDIGTQQQIAKTVVLEYQYPEVYNYIKDNPHMMSRIALCANDVRHDIDIVHLKDISNKYQGMADLWEGNPGLKSFLTATAYIDIENYQLYDRVKKPSSERNNERLVLMLDNYIHGKIRQDELVVNIKDCVENDKYESVVDVIESRINIPIVTVSEQAIRFAFRVLESNVLDVLSNKRLLPIAVNGWLRSSNNYEMRIEDMVIILRMSNLLEVLKQDVMTKLVDTLGAVKYGSDDAYMIMSSVAAAIVGQCNGLSSVLCRKIEEERINATNTESRISLYNHLKAIEYSKEERMTHNIKIPSVESMQAIINTIGEPDCQRSECELGISVLLQHNNYYDISSVSADINKKMEVIWSDSGSIVNEDGEKTELMCSIEKLVLNNGYKISDETAVQVASTINDIISQKILPCVVVCEMLQIVSKCYSECKVSKNRQSIAKIFKAVLNASIAQIKNNEDIVNIQAIIDSISEVRNDRSETSSARKILVEWSVEISRKEYDNTNDYQTEIVQYIFDKLKSEMTEEIDSAIKGVIEREIRRYSVGRVRKKVYTRHRITEF